MLEEEEEEGRMGIVERSTKEKVFMNIQSVGYIVRYDTTLLKGVDIILLQWLSQTTAYTITKSHHRATGAASPQYMLYLKQHPQTTKPMPR